MKNIFKYKLMKNRPYLEDFLVYTIVTTTILYLAGLFLESNWNIFQWSKNTKNFLVVVYSLIEFIISIICLINYLIYPNDRR